MNDLLPMRVVQRRRNGARDLHGLFERELMLAFEALPQRLALDERHHVIQQVVGLAGVVHRHDVRMLQATGDLDLAQESLGAEALGEMRVKHFERDRTVMADVLRAVHRRHAAATDFMRDVVAARERGPQLGEYVHVATASSSSTESASGRKAV